eukprot:c23130_g1_i1 orf=384-1166(+)
MEETTFKWDGGLLLDCLSRMRFRLKASARHRLALDIAALCTGLRAVIMVDYAREVSQLQNQLSNFLHILAQEIRLISSIKVMCMDDIVYLIHVENLCVLMDETLKHSIKLEFVVLDDAEVRFALPMEKEEALNHFASFKNSFLLQVSRGMKSPEIFPLSGKDCPKANVADIIHGSVPLETCQGSQSIIAHTSSSSIGLIDLGSSEACCEAALPTLNGWLLGYPVIYLLQKENISKAVRTLSFSTFPNLRNARPEIETWNA